MLPTLSIRVKANVHIFDLVRALLGWGALPNFIIASHVKKCQVPILLTSRKMVGIECKSFRVRRRSAEDKTVVSIKLVRLIKILGSTKIK